MQTKLCLVSKINSPKTAKDHLLHDVAILLEQLNVRFQKYSVDTLVKTFVINLTYLLWHRTCHHGYYQERSAPIPQIFKAFKDRNDFKKKKNAKPKLSSEDLGNLINLLSSKKVHPWLCKNPFTKLHTAIVDLLDSTNKIIQHMSTNIAKSCHVKSLTLLVRNPNSNSQVSEIINN